MRVLHTFILGSLSGTSTTLLINYIERNYF